MTNHPKDRHVLAAAVRCNAELLVTFNRKDFTQAALEPYSISVAGPSRFLQDLYELDPETVLSTIERQAASINRTVDYVLQRLAVNTPEFVSSLRARA